MSIDPVFTLFTDTDETEKTASTKDQLWEWKRFGTEMRRLRVKEREKLIQM